MRDDIGQAQAAARRRERLLFWLLVVVVLSVFGYAIRHYLRKRNQPRQGSSSREFQFAERTLQLPVGWQFYDDGSSALTAVLTRNGPGPTAPVITIDDERQHPEIQNQFVSGWKSAQHKGGFDPQSIDTYYDASVNAAGAVCVRVNWGGTQRPFKIICLSNDGQWKLSLSGKDADIRAFDLMAEQLPVLERR